MYDSLRNTLDVHPAVVVEMHYDSDANDPRSEFDHTATFALSHRRYDLADEADLSDTLVDLDGFEAVVDYLKAEHDAVLVKTVYGYDHGQLTCSTTPYSCPWDSGILGFAFVTKAAMDEGWGAGQWTEENALAVIVSEVTEYAQYLTGSVYGYVVKDALTEEVLDSCWGFYGDDYAEQEAREQGAYQAQSQVALAEVQAHALNDALVVPDAATALAAHLATA